MRRLELWIMLQGLRDILSMRCVPLVELLGLFPLPALAHPYTGCLGFL